MGQAESLSISGGDGHRYWVSIKPKPISRGRKKTIYKGIMFGPGPRQGEKVVVKAFTDISGSRDAWSHEVSKADVAKQMARMFLADYCRNTKIRIVMPGIVEMDKVSKFDNWREGRSGGRGLCKDEWISIEEYITGQFCRYCPWTVLPTGDGADPVTHSDVLQTFSHFTFMQSRGEMVACDFQGINRDVKSGQNLFIVTDSILHSRHKLYGVFDEGELGITDFFKLHKCTDICRSWPKPCPLTPPPTFDEACAQLASSITPPPSFTDIVFPSYQLDSAQSDGQFNRRRRPASERRRRDRPAMISHDTDCLQDQHSRRRHASERRPQRNNQLIVPDVEAPTQDGIRPRSHSNAGESLEQYLDQYRRTSTTLSHCSTMAAESSSADQPAQSDSDRHRDKWTLYPDAPPAYESVCGLDNFKRQQPTQAPNGCPELSRPTPTCPEMPQHPNSSLQQQLHPAVANLGQELSTLRLVDPGSETLPEFLNQRSILHRSSTLPSTTEHQNQALSANDHQTLRRSETWSNSNRTNLETRRDDSPSPPQALTPLLRRRAESGRSRTELVPFTIPPSIPLPFKIC